MNTIVGLSTAGMTKFTYGSGVTALTVKESTLVETGGTIGAKLSADEMTVTLDGSIAANGFAVIDHTNFRDLEEFFDIGGTIGLHDTDSADDDDDNSREVIISEILWGLDFGATVIANQNQWQFIELYNTTNTTIDLTVGRSSSRKGDLFRRAMLIRLATDLVWVGKLILVRADVSQARRLLMQKI